MMIPSGLQMPVSVLGLLLCLLLASGLVKRYQEFKAYQRARLRALVTQTDRLEQAMEQLARIPMSQPLRSAVRGHIARQYVLIRQLNKAHPNIDSLVDKSRSRAAGDGGASSGRVAEISGRIEYVRTLEALEEVLGLVARGGGVLADKRMPLAQWLQELRERRAEVSARFFIVEAHRAQSKGDRKNASAHLHALLEQLHQRGPDTGFVRELYHEAEGMYARAIKGLTILEGTEPEAITDQISNNSSAA